MDRNLNPCSLIPSYNEARTIGEIVKKLKQLGFPVYMVDDGSTDDTARIAEAAGALVIRNVRNFGKGAALREGFKRVLEDGFGTVLLMDGDDQHDIDDIEHLMARMRQTGADIVIGNRMRDIADMPVIRIVVNRFMSYVLSKVCGQYIPDTQCGFRLIKREALLNIKLESSKYEIESEMIVKAARAGLRIESVPIKTVYRGEQSKINPLVDTLRFLRLMMRLLWRK